MLCFKMVEREREREREREIQRYREREILFREITDSRAFSRFVHDFALLNGYMKF